MVTKRQIFYSFHYKPDCWRASIIRSIGAIEGNRPAPDNDWETITSSGDEAIKKWISEQMKYRSCTIVLVGNKTADRKWINHEIVNKNIGKFGIVKQWRYVIVPTDKITISSTVSNLIK